MTNKFHLLLVMLFIVCLSCNNTKDSNSTDLISTIDNDIKVTPINHGSLVLTYDDVSIYIDPVGGLVPYMNEKSPDLILVTDIHGDHHNNETLEAISKSKTKIVLPAAVSEKLATTLKSKAVILNNLESTTFDIDGTSITIEALPMYNLREEALKFHPKGRGNGYIISLGEYRVYISGDTEDIPEMRNLKDIDMAFVCMNLPWTMPVNAAASAVLDFKPKIVYPFHYRGTDGLSDVNEFKRLVQAKDSMITVRLENWYANR
ncbi:MAG: MBL fold metallo-hydrolase [bacterium]